jgi:hypothetical protein
MKLGYKCLYVTVIPDGVRLGHVCCEDPLIGAHADKIEHALKVLIGAGLAEARQIGSKTWGDADDRASATRLALQATNGDAKRAEALIDQVASETRELVEQHWPDIQRLAQRLLVEGHVNFLETRARAS